MCQQVRGLVTSASRRGVLQLSLMIEKGLENAKLRSGSESPNPRSFKPTQQRQNAAVSPTCGGDGPAEPINPERKPRPQRKATTVKPDFTCVYFQDVRLLLAGAIAFWYNSDGHPGRRAKPGVGTKGLQNDN